MYQFRIDQNALKSTGKIDNAQLNHLMDIVEKSLDQLTKRGPVRKSDKPLHHQCHTFGDYLIQTGYPLHPETVIMDATAVNAEMYRRENAGEPPITARDSAGELCLPPYDHLLLEWRDMSGGDLPIEFYAGIIAYWQAARLERVGDDTYRLHTLCLRFDGVLLEGHAPMRLVFDKGHLVTFDPTRPDPSRVDDNTLINQHGKEYVVFALWALTLLHQKTDVEQVTHKRGPRRKYARKHGKEPSPYFRFRDIRPGATRTPTADSTPTGRKMPVHSVRGHFRHYTDGKVVWIRPHMRGSGNAVQDRPYRIVLPKTP